MAFTRANPRTPAPPAVPGNLKLGSFNVLEAARLSGNNPHVIYSSTNKVYGGMEDVQIAEHETRYMYANLPLGIPETQLLDFHSPYGCSKGAADQYVLDYARSYAPLVRRISETLQNPPCVETVGLSRGQIAALQFHSQLHLRAASAAPSCPWLLANGEALASGEYAVDATLWTPYRSIKRPTDRTEHIRIFSRSSP